MIKIDNDNDDDLDDTGTNCNENNCKNGNSSKVQSIVKTINLGYTIIWKNIGHLQLVF